VLAHSDVEVVAITQRLARHGHVPLTDGQGDLDAADSDDAGTCATAGVTRKATGTVSVNGVPTGNLVAVAVNGRPTGAANVGAGRHTSLSLNPQTGKLGTDRVVQTHG
jgi:hypothetical protein